MGGFPDSYRVVVVFADSDTCYCSVLGFRKCSWTVSPTQIMFFVCFPDSDPGVGPVSQIQDVLMGCFPDSDPGLGHLLVQQ